MRSLLLERVFLWYSEELSICWRSLIYSYLKPDFPVLFFVWKCLLILFIYLLKKIHTIYFNHLSFHQFPPNPLHLSTHPPLLPPALSSFLSQNCKAIPAFSVHHTPTSWFLALPVQVQRGQGGCRWLSPSRSTLHLASALSLPAAAHFAASPGCSQILELMILELIFPLGSYLLILR